VCVSLQNKHERVQQKARQTEQRIDRYSMSCVSVCQCVCVCVHLQERVAHMTHMCRPVGASAIAALRDEVSKLEEDEICVICEWT
jgi:hypothetical protein